MTELRWNGRRTPPRYDDLIADLYRGRPERRDEVRENVEAWLRLKAMSKETK